MQRMIRGVRNGELNHYVALRADFRNWMIGVNDVERIRCRAITMDQFHQFKRFGLRTAAQVDEFVMAQQAAPSRTRIGRECFVELKLVKIRNGAGGDGNGIIIQRGMPRPTSYHDERLRGADDQHFFDVITNGYGAMYSYASRVPPQDRWAIIAYIRVLQLSRHAEIEDVPQDARAQLTGPP